MWDLINYYTDRIEVTAVNQVKLYYNRRSVGQSVLVSGTPFWGSE
jgi:hypothetical protein